LLPHCGPLRSCPFALIAFGAVVAGQVHDGGLHDETAEFNEMPRGYAMILADLIGCTTARNKGTCENRRSIRRGRLEERVLNALRYHLMDPTLFKESCDELTREINRLRMEGSATIEAARSEVRWIERELDKLLELILKGGAADAINAKMVQLEHRKAELER
jgi:hypothetical protein